MSVEKLLDKIITYNEGAVGAIAIEPSGRVRHNLRGPFDMLDVDALAEQVSDMFAIAESADDGTFAFDDMILEFENHGVVAKRMEDATLVMLTDQVRRARLKKIQVNMGLYAKPLAKALATDASAVGRLGPAGERRPMPLVAERRVAGPLTAPPPLPSPAPHPAPPEFAAPAEPHVDAPLEADDDTDPNKGKRRRVYRGQVYYD